ncbi:MAG: class I SAM-dependent methyltransferase [Oligoflexia bacterium]|nr:class I SAM-dependent methyltransferase [Oligoflexia bacterium]
MTTKINNPSEYKISDLVHNGELYDYINRSDDDLEFYKKWCSISKSKTSNSNSNNGSTDSTCLELCSGTGRLTIPLAQSGIDIVGVDYTESMLKRASEKAQAKNIAITFVQQDIRELQLKHLNKNFCLIFIPFNSLQCLYSLDDLERFFKQVKAHMANDGLFIVDIFNPNIKIMIDRSIGWKNMINFKMDNGKEVKITEQCNYDAASEINRVKWKHSIDGEETIEQLDMRCFWPLEMDAILKYNGFEVIHKFGNFDESKFTSDSPKQIYVLKKAR